MNKHIIFYDGHCGLCHGWVLFVIHFDKSEKFKFSPLQGETIKQLLSPEIIEGLPDSIVVKSESDGIFLKSKAVEFIMKEIGGVFHVFYWILKIFPDNLKNMTYDFVARIRKKILGVKEDLCPILPDKLRIRFLP